MNRVIRAGRRLYDDRHDNSWDALLNYCPSRKISKVPPELHQKTFPFSMGIPSVGSMRQRGNHPIALRGRVHFDDPYLFEQNFVFKLGECLGEP